MSKQTTIQDPLAAVAKGLAGRTPDEAPLRSMLLHLALLAECPPAQAAQARARVFPPRRDWRRKLGGPLPRSTLSQALRALEGELCAGVAVSQAIDTQLRKHLRPSWRHLLRRAEASGQLGPALRWVASQPALTPAPDIGLASCFVMDGGIYFMVTGAVSLFIFPLISKSFMAAFPDGVAAMTAHTMASHDIGLAIMALSGLACAWHVVGAGRLGPWATAWASYLPTLGRRHRWQRQEEAAAIIAWLLSQDADLLAALRQAHEAIACPWLRPRLKRAHDAILAGQPWQDAWLAQSLVAPEDAWLLHAGARQGEPAKALHTLSLILRGRARRLTAYYQAWMTAATTLAAGAVIGWQALWIFRHLYVFGTESLLY